MLLNYTLFAFCELRKPSLWRSKADFRLVWTWLFSVSPDEIIMVVMPQANKDFWHAYAGCMMPPDMFYHLCMIEPSKVKTVHIWSSASLPCNLATRAEQWWEKHGATDSTTWFHSSAVQGASDGELQAMIQSLRAKSRQKQREIQRLREEERLLQREACTVQTKRSYCTYLPKTARKASEPHARARIAWKWPSSFTPSIKIRKNPYDWNDADKFANQAESF